MRVVAVANQKGGAAKTTTAVNVAAALGETGHRTLVVDLDPQANATGWLGVQKNDELLNVFLDGRRLEDLVQASSAPGVDVVPGSLALARVEAALAGEAGAQVILREAVAKLSGRWEFVFFDCPPALGLLSISALVASREVLVPVTAHAMSLEGLAELEGTLEKVRARMNPDVDISALVACRTTRTVLSRDVVETVRGRFGKRLLKASVRESIRLAEAPSRREPITIYDGEGSGAEDYRAVAKEFLKLGKGRGRA